MAWFRVGAHYDNNAVFFFVCATLMRAWFLPFQLCIWAMPMLIPSRISLIVSADGKFSRVITSSQIWRRTKWRKGMGYVYAILITGFCPINSARESRHLAYENKPSLLCRHGIHTYTSKALTGTRCLPSHTSQTNHSSATFEAHLLSFQAIAHA